MKILKLYPVISGVAFVTFLCHPALADTPAVWHETGQTHTTELDIKESISTDITLEKGAYDDGVDALVTGDNNYINATITDSEFKSETGNALKLDAEGGPVNLTVSDSSFSTGSDDHSHDIEIFGEGGASLAITDHSTLNEGAYVWSENGNATVSVTDSAVGVDTSPAYNDNYVLTAQIDQNSSAGEGTAEVDVDNSNINGNIAAQAQNDGNAVVNITDNAQVNGYIYAIGQNVQVNVDNSTLNGNIYTGLLGEEGFSASTNTLAFTNTIYRNDIISENVDDSVDDSLTVDINGGAIIGGETIDDPMKITGYSNVDFNINYVDQSLVDTGKVSYFYVDDAENITVNSSLANGTLAPVRSGSYIYDDVTYSATDNSQQTSTADTGKTYGVTFNTDAPPTPDDVASSIQASQAGLMASDEMIHHVAEGISTELENGQVNIGNNLWIHGIYSSDDRNASQTAYSNDIGGIQIGGDTSFMLKNNDIMSTGFAYARLHDNLDLTNAHGGNDINGDYYSAYLRWRQHHNRNDRSSLFADTVFTYGSLQYSSNGNDENIVSGGDYRGHSYLMQSRIGNKIAVDGQTWITPYALIGYENIHQDGYNDGYSDVSEGMLHSGFYGAGVKVSTECDLADSMSVTPFLNAGYVGQFANQAHLETNDYSFAGQNLNGGKVGVGMEMQPGKHWHTLLGVNMFYGHDVSHDINALFSIRYNG